MTNRSLVRATSEADATEYLRQNGFDDGGKPLVFDLEKMTLVKAPSLDALTSGSLPGVDPDMLTTPSPDEHVTVPEQLTAMTRMQRHLRWVAYMVGLLSSKGGAEERSEQGQRLLELAESREQRDLLAATIYRDLSDIGLKSDEVVSRLSTVMACSPASTYTRIQRGNEHLRAGIVALGGELSLRAVAPRPKVNMRIATRRTRYDSGEWRQAIKRFPASRHYEFIHYLTRQIVQADLAVEDASETRLKMIPHRVDAALDEMGINSRALRRLLGGMSEHDRDAWIANSYAEVVRTEFFGTSRQRVEIRQRVSDELFEKHAKQVLRQDERSSPNAAKIVSWNEVAA